MDNPIVLPVVPEAIGVDSLWFDPRLLSIVTYPYIHDVALAGLSNEFVVQANIQRLAIGFALGSGFVTANISPWPDPQSFQLLVLSGMVTGGWFELKKYGPIVSSAWYVYATAAASIRVIEILRKA